MNLSGIDSIHDWKADFIDNSGDILVRYDRNYRHLYVNKATEREARIPASEMIGKSNRELNMPNNEEELNIWESKIDEVFSTGLSTHYYTFHEYSNGIEYYHTKFIPEFLPSGEVRSVIALTRNISELKKAQKKLEESKQKLKLKNTKLNQLNKYLDNFVHVVAHDLKSPVDNLKGLITQIRKEENQENKHKYLSYIEKSIDRLDQTINGLVETISIKNDKEALVKKLSFQDILTNVLADLQNHMEYNQVKIDTDFSRNPAIVYIESYLLSIIKNLVTNALKYASPERSLSLSISTKKKDNAIVLEVRDNGIGIDLKKHGNKIFMPFKRFTSQAQGNGMGLNIVKTIVEKNGGKIAVESQPNAGTTFKVYLLPYTF